MWFQVEEYETSRSVTMSEVTRRPVSSPVEEAEKEMEEEHQEKGVNNTFLEDGESKATQVEPKKGGFFSRLKGVLSPTVEGATPLNKTIIGVVFLSLVGILSQNSHDTCHLSSGCHTVIDTFALLKYPLPKAFSFTCYSSPYASFFVKLPDIT